MSRWKPMIPLDQAWFLVVLRSLPRSSGWREGVARRANAGHHKKRSTTHDAL
jgi:hypothetical protein